MKIPIRLEFKIYGFDQIKIEAFCRFTIFHDFPTYPSPGDVIQFDEKLGLFEIDRLYWLSDKEKMSPTIVCKSLVCSDEAEILSFLDKFKKHMEIADLETSSEKPPVYYLLYRTMVDVWGRDLEVKTVLGDSKTAIIDILRAIFCCCDIAPEDIAFFLEEFVEAFLRNREASSILQIMRMWHYSVSLPQRLDEKLMTLTKKQIQKEWVKLAQKRRTITSDSLTPELAEMIEQK